MIAIVIGGTGLVGKALVQQLLKDDSFSTIKLLLRRKTGLVHHKLKEFIVDFEQPNSFKADLTGDVLFSTMGTTIKKAGSQAAQYKVDYTFQFEAAKIAVENGVSTYVLVSSGGANSASNFFYARMKGELDNAVSKLNFEKIIILRPSVLLGNRGENRFFEKIGMTILGRLKNVPFIKKYRGIKDIEVAKAMIHLAKQPSNTKASIYEYDEIFEYAR